MSTQAHYNTLVSFFLPEGLLEYFDVVAVDTKREGLEIYLEEKNKAPEGFTDEQLHFKGFHEQIKVEDFPIRG